MAPSTTLRSSAGEMPLAEHLEELRARLIRCTAYVALGLAAGWGLFPQVYALLWAPMAGVLGEHPGWGPFLPDITQGFTLRLHVSFYAGLLLALPLVTLEAWAFLAPGLTRRERRACRLLVPLSLGLFFLGAGCGCALMGPSLRWFAAHVPPGWIVMQTPVPYLTLMVKMVVGFGLAFQAPVLVLLLAWLELVTSAGLRRSWRLCMVACLVVGALATPGGDPFTMLLLGAPLALLYGVCVLLCSLVERFRPSGDGRR